MNSNPDQIAQRSEELFRSRLCCSESVLQALAEGLGVQSELIPKIATGLCEGVSRSGNICGAVSGGVLGISLCHGRTRGDQSPEQTAKQVRGFLTAFEERFGGSNCEKLMGCRLDTPEGQAFFKEHNLREKCAEYTREAARLAAEVIEKSGKDPLAYAVSLGYSEDEIRGLPAEAVVSHGCGNAVSRAWLRSGETVLDLGSGAGLDAFLAARQVGPTGRVIGVDMSLEMVERGNATAKKADLENVEFRQAPIERLPLADGSIDVAISNCVMNHCADKVQAFKEVFRVLKGGGRLCLSDLVASGTDD